MLDPVLSLTGGTGATPIDPIPDPGPAHPKKSFNGPCGVTTDAYGNIYVANGASQSLSDGIIDIFSSSGEFITEVPDVHRPCSIAVNSAGSLYVLRAPPTSEVMRYDPVVYEPAVSNIEYGPAPSATVVEGVEGMGLDPSNDHLYFSYGNSESKFKFEERQADGSVVDSFTENAFADPRSIAIWAQGHDVYSSGSPWLPEYDPGKSVVTVLDAATHAVKLSLDGSDTPAGNFGFSSGRGGIALDQSNGDIYVDATEIHHVVYQFDADGDYIGELFLPENKLKAAEPFSAIAVDQGEHSPNQGYVYVTSGPNSTSSHLYAFAPRNLKPPEVRGERVEEAGETEVLLSAEINPGGAPTGFRVEYGTGDCASTSCQSAPIPDAQAGSGASFQPVSVSLGGLQPRTTYHFRVVAVNHCNPLVIEEECVTEGSDGTFTTFSAIPAQSCPNEAARTGPSAGLVDCRAYELVTPPDTNGRIPTAAAFGTTITMPPLLLARADGQSVIFGTEGGTLPGSQGGGFYDTFRATRSADGWHTAFGGLTGVQAQELYPGAVSSDHAYSLWKVEKGSLEKGEYLRSPDGTVEKVGIGSAGTVQAEGRWVGAGATHVIFTASVPLESGAPPNGTTAVYDRSPGGPTQVVSLLPGDVTPTAGESATYLGTAAEGSVVAFRLAGAIYVRIDNSETLKIVDEPAAFGGIASNGSRVFYVKGGDVFAFETATQTTTAIGSGGESTMVTVSAEGSHVYFVSPLVLTSSEENSQGASALAGEENLYVWDRALETVRFVATVEEADVIGEEPPAGGTGSLIGGLGLWVSDAVAPGQDRFRGWANDPSRTSPDGQILVFEARVRLTGFDNEGHAEIYRYDASSAELGCVSCNPTGAPPASDARLESRYAPLLFSIPPVNAVSQITNLAAGGDVVFFQSGDRLAPGDGDGKIDVYEWQAPGVKTCQDEEGCIHLISGGRSGSDDYLYGASSDGSSVFFLSGDTLVDEDLDGTPSLYVAREGGGFVSHLSPPAACLGETCQPAVEAPDDPTPASSTFLGAGNARPKPRHCSKHHSRKSHARRDRRHCTRRHGRHVSRHRGRRASR